MSKYNTDLDYVIPGIDITREELEEIKSEADKIISENKESNENLAMAYLKKAQCLRKLKVNYHYGLTYYDERGSRLLTKERICYKKLLEKALELLPDMPEAIMQLGLLNNPGWLSDKYDKAINIFNKAIQLKPDYAAAFNSRAMIFFELEHICKLLSGSNDQKDNERLVELKKKIKINFRSAVEDLTKAITIRPFDAVYFLNRGVFHSRLEEHKEAVEDFSNAINFASDIIKERLKIDEKIFYLRGKEYTELKKYDKAIEDFSETLIVKPDHDETLLLRGKAYYLAGEKEKAKADITEYLSRKRKATDDASRNEIIRIVGVTPEEYILSEKEKQEMENIAKWALGIND